MWEDAHPMTGAADGGAARSRGFTIIELLVVVAIIGLLVALLLPAIGIARESSRRSQCLNQLRQIALAIHEYHEAIGSFPPGNVTRGAGICLGGPSGSQGYPSEDGANWCLSILPFVEQPALFEAYDFEDYNEAWQNREVCETVVAIYTCPSDLRTEQLSVPATGPASALALNLPYRPGSYRAVAGRSDGLRYLDSAELGAFPREDRGAIHTIGVLNFTTEKYQNVTDGLSNTLMLGESATRTNPSMRTFWAYAYAHYSLSSVTAQPRTLWGDYDACKAAGGYGGPLACRRGWGSMHPGVINFALCDASVRSIALGVDMKVLESMSTIGKEDTLPTPW